MPVPPQRVVTMTAPPVTVTPHWGGRSRDIKKE
jgi:hypothetical protein